MGSIDKRLERRVNRYRGALGLLTAVVCAVLSTAAKAHGGVHEWEDAPVCPVARIIDGDTVELAEDLSGGLVKVRLIGVDTPETVHPQKPVEEYGREASAFLRNLLQGESVYVVYDQDRLDAYGRTLAYLYRVPDGLFVNAEIVRQGYGHAYTRFPFRHLAAFREYERLAREAGRGLWGVAGPGTVPVTAVEPAPAEFGSSDLQAASDVATSGSADKGVTVYLTKTGAKYHREGCRFLAKSKIPVTLEEAKARGKGPCGVCSPPR